MAILAKIRERSIFLILIIALGLLAFLIDPSKLLDLFRSGGTKEYVVKVNDETVRQVDFARQVEAIQRNSQQSSLQVANQVFDRQVEKILLEEEFEKLGIVVGNSQMWDLSKAAYGFYPQFKGEDGQLDEGKLKAFLEEQDKNNPQAWKQEEERIAYSGKQNFYYSLVEAASLATEKDGEIAYRMGNDLVDVNYVYLPFTTIADSTVNIASDKVQAYMTAHADEFKEKANASMQYVFFEEKPSASDIAAIKTKMEGFIPQLKAKDSIALTEFISENSATPIDTVYKVVSGFDTPLQVQLDSMQVNEVYGPYEFGEFTKAAKLTGIKSVTKVKSSHILIAYKGAQRANPSVTRTEEEAEAKANELFAEIKASDKDFAEFARTNSDGPSAQKGGDLGWNYDGAMVKPFNDFTFQNDKGTIGVVKTDFGYHIVKVTDTMEEKQFQVAQLSLKNEATQETINKLYSEANEFEVDVNGADFTKIAEEKQYSVRPVNKVDALSENLPGINTPQRTIVKWMFNPETKIGDVRRFDINGSYAVVQLTERREEGLQSVEDGSFKVSPILRKEAKAEQLKAKISGNTIEEIAKNSNTSVRTSNAISMANPIISGAGREPLVVGTAFGLGEGKLSKAIVGVNGVYVIEVTKVTEAAKLDSYKNYANKTSNPYTTGQKVVEALKKNAEIEDNRGDFY